MRKILTLLTFALPLATYATTWVDSTQRAPSAPVYDSRNAPDNPPAVPIPAPGTPGSHNTDIQITQGIRKGIYSDTALPNTSKNISVLTVRGHVTLRGNVNNINDRARIEAITKSIPGVLSIDNQITAPQE